MENSTPDYQKEVLDYLGRAHKGTVIAKALQTMGPTRDKALKERDKYATEALTKDSFYEDGKPRYTEDALKALPEKEKEQALDTGLAYRQSSSIDKAADIASRNLETILKKGDVYDSDLKKISNVRDVVENASDKYRELLTGYAPIAGLEKLAKDKEEGKSLSPEEDEQAKKLVSAAAQERYLEANKNLSERTRKLGAQLAALSPSENYSAKELKAGVERIVKESKDALKKKFGDDYEVKISQGVAEALGKMLKSGDEKSQQAALNFYFLAKKGYQIGDKEFPEEFKEKKD